MHRIYTTVDSATLQLIDEEAARRGIPRARLLREAALFLIGASTLDRLQRTVADHDRRIARVEHHLDLDSS